MPASLDLLPVDKIRAVFTDLDGTLTEEPYLLPQTYQALWDLKASGLWTVIVSGRPAGWSDALMRVWPLDAFIFENGAGVVVRRGEKLETHFLAGEPSAQRARLESVFEKIRALVPTAKLAGDQRFRLFDYAVDFHEEPPRLTDAQVQSILDLLAQEPGITAKLSSIHINYWLGSYTKVTACEWLLASEGASRGIAKEEVAFSGDSPNDEPLFAFFPHSVGVANIEKFLPQLRTPPRYVSPHLAGKGFQDLALRLNARSRK